jgi:hypothetical protein
VHGFNGPLIAIAHRYPPGGAMTVSDLIAKLSSYPTDARVTLLDPCKGWLLPIEIRPLAADGSSRDVDFVAITSDRSNDEIKGMAD